LSLVFKPSLPRFPSIRSLLDGGAGVANLEIAPKVHRPHKTQGSATTAGFH
jgi:hypothetical protein